jgi:hypothetical protein
VGYTSCIPHVDSVSRLFVFVLCLVSLTLTVSLDCLRPVFCGHCQRGVHKTQDEDNPETLSTWGAQDTGRRQSRDTVCLVYPTLTVSLDCLRPVFCVPHVDSVSRLFVFVLCLVYPTLIVSLDENKQSRDTVNVGYTRHRTKTIQRHCQRVDSVSGLSSSCVLCTPG